MTITSDETLIKDMFDFEVPCGFYEDVINLDCELAADWFAKTHCCGMNRLVCSPHRLQTIKMVNDALDASFPGKCVYCLVAVVSLDEWISFTPL